MQAPSLRKQGNTTQLIVNGRPFLVIGGELHNSSSSSLQYMQPIWQRMLEMNFNTVLAGVSWELVEPEEGRFDFALVDGLIEEARRQRLRLIFLWFASWKNGLSSYIPGWVKRDTRRFVRAKLASGRPVELLSTLCPANAAADAKAFAALLTHLREIDSREQTVLMVQVENEVGVLGDSRDRCEPANRAFAGSVPSELLTYLQEHRDEIVPEMGALWEQGGRKSTGTWAEVFGSGEKTDELFMAWHYARYVEQVAAAGKAAYPLPLYVNAWLCSPNQKPGEYPSGGPLPHVMDCWLAGAPHIDLLAPDIYLPEFEDWSGRYVRRGNPLFIPEMRSGEDGCRNIFYAIGQHEAIGVSPFAVDSIQNPKEAPLAQAYAILRQLEPLILEHQGKGAMAGFILDKEHPSTTRQLGDYELTISLDAIFGRSAETGHGLVIQTGPDEFVGAAQGVGISFRAKSGETAGLLEVDEGAYRNGEWIPGRRLNGDENDQGQKWRFNIHHTSIERCRTYRWQAE